MRRLRRVDRQAVAGRRRAAWMPQIPAWAVIASLFALLISQPFHAAGHDPRGGAPELAAAAPLSWFDSAHDANLCSFCRASAQTRLGLRLALRVSGVALEGASFARHLPAPAPLKAAPLLRPAQPRAPPAALPLVSA
jgi:hypothetical protein